VPQVQRGRTIRIPVPEKEAEKEASGRPWDTVDLFAAVAAAVVVAAVVVAAVGYI